MATRKTPQKKTVTPKKTPIKKEESKVAEITQEKKVIEVPLEPKKKPENVIFDSINRSGNDFDIILNGKHRKVTRMTYLTLSRDPERYHIELPKDSPLSLIELDKPCKDC